VQPRTSVPLGAKKALHRLLLFPRNWERERRLGRHGERERTAAQQLGLDAEHVGTVAPRFVREAGARARGGVEARDQVQWIRRVRCLLEQVEEDRKRCTEISAMAVQSLVRP
jgi:hypothetical protein